MKVFKNVIVPAKTVKTLDKVICDICKKEGTNYWNEGNKWVKGNYCVNNTIIEHKIGNDYGADGKDIITKYFDICNDCFDNKVVPALESLGAVMYEEESDW